MALKERFFQNLDLIGGFEPNPKVAVAVSGGVDSMALLWLTWQWVRAKGGQLTSLTVDHRLRRESTKEAEWVHHHCQDHGILHDILTWEMPAQTGNIMAQAREARYHLLQDYCYQHSIPHLFVGHQADDQLETFILHLERGSGLKGLSSMAPVTDLSYGRLLRPLLAEWRAELQMFLKDIGWNWHEDPSNINLDYDRIKARKSLDGLRQAGVLNPSRWLTSITALGQSQDYVAQNVLNHAADVLQIYPEGFACIDYQKIKTLSPIIAKEILAQILTHISGNDYPPRWYQLETLWDLLMAGPQAKRTTLGGCLVIQRKNQIFICRELSAMDQPPLEAQDKDYFLWDNRFNIEGVKDLSPFFIAALGKKGWRQMIAVDKTLKKLPYPQEVVMALPAIWQKTREGLDILLAVPNLSYKMDKNKTNELLDKVVIKFKPKSHFQRKAHLKLIGPKSSQQEDYHCG